MYLFCSFHNLQQDKRSKTQWHKPLTNVIFSSHFKGISRNEEFHIDQLVAKGAFGIVFKVIDKKHYVQPEHQRKGDTCATVYALKVLKKSKVYKIKNKNLLFYSLIVYCLFIDLHFYFILFFF